MIAIRIRTMPIDLSDQSSKQYISGLASLHGSEGGRDLQRAATAEAAGLVILLGVVLASCRYWNTATEYFVN